MGTKRLADDLKPYFEADVVNCTAKCLCKLEDGAVCAVLMKVCVLYHKIIV